MCGNSRESWNTSPTRRRSGASADSASPSTITRQCSARSRPATAATTLDLPEPDGPNSATTPGVGASNATSSAKPG